jgi:hypothetical protein
MGMSIELQDGERLLKLSDTRSATNDDSAHDGLTIVRLWQLLSGGQALRDVGERRFL